MHSSFDNNATSAETESLSKYKSIISSDVVLEARLWPRGASRPIFYDLGLGLGLGTYGLGLGTCGLGLGLEGPGLGFESCINNLSPSPSNSR